jgi:hypothetical protein
MKLSDEQARAIGVMCVEAWYSTHKNGTKHQTCWKDDGEGKDVAAVGHAAFAACREIVLKEAKSAISQLKDMNHRDGAWDCGWNDALSEVHTRLDSLTQPPSKREKVEAVLDHWGWKAGDGRAEVARQIDAIYKESE